MVKQLRKFAATNMITKVEKRDSETTLKALSAEAEFHWVLKNQVGRLALELADFCESHAKLLEGDAVLCLFTRGVRLRVIAGVCSVELGARSGVLVWQVGCCGNLGEFMRGCRFYQCINMREEKRRRARDEEFSAAKKRRDNSPSAHHATSGASTSKSRGHIPVSERQQFALLKLMETRTSPSDRGAKQVWEGQEPKVCESERPPPAPPPPATKGQPAATLTATTTTDGSTPGRYSSPYQESGHQVDRSKGIHNHSHCHHGHGHSSSSSSSHHSGSRKSSQQQHRSGGSESPLMRVSKKGDLLTLKMMVKEGADVNEQDANGRTALHESSLQNFLHVVSYLLKHNANPNVQAVPRSGGGTGTGDTPLHEATREGHIRIIRALLRYGADPKICNNNGDRPTDLCPNEASQLVFKQSNQSRDYPVITNTPAASSVQVKKASITSTSKSPPPPPSEGHHQVRSSFVEEQGGSGGGSCTKRRGSPDLSSPSPACGQRQQHPTKKDPYAFDDEEVETTSQPNEVNVAQASTNAAATTSSSPLQPHRFNTTFVPTGTTTVATVISSSLHINTALGDTLHSASSSASPNATVSGGVAGGPPLKLRFAMEAGHYTVMENQENPSEQAAVVVTSSTAVTAAVPAAASTIIDVPPVQEGVVITKAEELNQSSSMDANFRMESNLSVSLEETVDRDSDSGRSPKVPPLRIKLGNSTPPPSYSHLLSSLPSELAQNESSASNSGDTAKEPTLGGERKQDIDDDTSTAVPQLKPKSETSSELAEGKEGGDVQDGNEVPKVEQEGISLAVTEDDEEKKLADAIPTSTSHQTKRGTGGGGKVVKVASSSDSTSLKRHAAPESGEVKLKDMSETKVDDTFKARSFRTLRSHTAAQREKEEREKNSDVAPLKKRKYRSKGSNGGSSAEGGGGGEADAGKSTDHEDAGIANEASSLPSSSTNEDTAIPGTAEEEVQSPSSEAITASSSCGQDQSSKPARVFDDPNKPSAVGWGENPYEKASELNRGLSELMGKLVELQPKEPTGYQDYLLVTRDYLLAGNIPHLIIRRQCPPELPQALIELFEEQEDERHTQALKHQSERIYVRLFLQEQLRLCAEQSVLRAQTRATIALANQPRPLSFCSVMALKGFTYLPAFKDPEHRDEESVRDRFKARTLIGWLQDIKDNFHMEKKKLLCRQLHEAESLMMVQKLDWEVKLKELHLYDHRMNIFDQIPSQHVPLIGVPSDFPLFVHDPIQRPS
ncbi:Ankyrin repeat domain-containing protein [Echinococcus granulosus]|uniref:Ankyrin repeat domain-containing protein n=1 Tax=Echinococcus granulosus TaxID=6210 RepID=W6TZS4_ECHGR|nr:Ankyrin repeat domain-containing protein [Echinococcus granulosus]EUB54248.1 Ankyrin repeat domain-containing protein [Echinococcus granulosus]